MPAGREQACCCHAARDLTGLSDGMCCRDHESSTGHAGRGPSAAVQMRTFMCNGRTVSRPTAVESCSARGQRATAARIAVEICFDDTSKLQEPRATKVNDHALRVGARMRQGAALWCGCVAPDDQSVVIDPRCSRWRKIRRWRRAGVGSQVAVKESWRRWWRVGGGGELAMVDGG